LALAWSADLRRALSGGVGGTLLLWDVETGRCLRRFEGHSLNVWSVAWSADHCRALTGGLDATLRLWDEVLQSVTFPTVSL